MPSFPQSMMKLKYLYVNKLKDSKIALLRYVISIQSSPILYHKLPKSPVFLQATVHLQACKPYFKDSFWHLVPFTPQDFILFCLKISTFELNRGGYYQEVFAASLQR